MTSAESESVLWVVKLAEWCSSKSLQRNISATRKRYPCISQHLSLTGSRWARVTEEVSTPWLQAGSYKRYSAQCPQVAPQLCVWSVYEGPWVVCVCACVCTCASVWKAVQQHWSIIGLISNSSTFRDLFPLSYRCEWFAPLPFILETGRVVFSPGEGGDGRPWTPLTGNTGGLAWEREAPGSHIVHGVSIGAAAAHLQ